MNHYIRNLCISAVVGLVLTVSSLEYSKVVTASTSEAGTNALYDTISRGYPLQYYSQYTIVYCPPTALCRSHRVLFSFYNSVIDYIFWFALVYAGVSVADYARIRTVRDRD